MEETLKSINEEQLKQLREHSDDETIELFFKFLNYNFGGGEVLPFDHILNVFEKGMIELNSQTNYAAYYIDAFRILGLLSKDVNEIKKIQKEDLVDYHDDLSQEFKAEASETLKQKFIDSMEPYQNLSDDYGTYRTSLIGTIEELDWEGKYMNHCIATYRHIVASGKYVGVKFFNENSWERLTLGFQVREDGTLVFDQLKNHSNYPASKESCEFAVDFCERNNIECRLEMSYDLKSLVEE